MTSQVIVIREGSLAEQALAHQFDFNLWFQEQLHSTPWWLASLIFHGLLILMLASLPNMEPPPIPNVPIVRAIKPDILPDVTRMPDPTPIKPLPVDQYQSVETPLPPVANPSDSPDESFDPTLLNVKFGDDTIGIGPGLGNRNGGGGPGGPGGKTIENQTVLAALKWLARHQNPDGSWGAKTFQHQCRISQCSGTGDAQFDTGLTGLALLAFTGAGYTTFSSRDVYDGICFGDVVRNAVLFLINQQLPDGSFSASKNGKFMYNQAICTYALADLYDQSKYSPAGLNFLEPAERAVRFLLESRNPGKAWRYQPKDGQNDTSVTGWVMMALKTAEHSGISVPAEA